MMVKKRYSKQTQTLFYLICKEFTFAYEFKVETVHTQGYTGTHHHEFLFFFFWIKSTKLASRLYNQKQIVYLSSCRDFSSKIFLYFLTLFHKIEK